MLKKISLFVSLFFILPTFILGFAFIIIDANEENEKNKIVIEKEISKFEKLIKRIIKLL